MTLRPAPRLLRGVRFSVEYLAGYVVEDSLFISAACYAICGVLLFVASPTVAERLRRFHRQRLSAGALRRAWEQRHHRHAK
jgi:hypothetical protein